MKLDFKNVTIGVMAVVIAILLLFRGCGNNEKAPATQKETTTTTIDYKTKYDSAVSVLMHQKPEKVPFYVYRDRITPASPETYPGDGLDWMVDGEAQDGEEFGFQFLNVYKDTLNLDNATVFSEITSDGKIYENKAVVETKEKTITTTKFKETIVNGSGLFLSGGAGVNTGLGVDNVNVGLDYIWDNNFGVGIQAQHNFTTEKPSFGVRVMKKIF